MSARLVHALRVALLIAAVGALFAAVIAGVARDRRDAVHVRYVCPMHAEVTASAPGLCPICHMDLEPVNASVPGAVPPPGAIKASTYETYDIPRRRAYGPDAPAPAWVEDDGGVTALLYIDELALRAPDERALFSPSSAPDTRVVVRATSDAPEPWDGSTRRVHYRIDAAASPPSPRDVGWLRRVVRSPEPAVVPYAAVLEDTSGPYVLVASPDGQMLTKRPVETGRVFGGVVAVPSGLRPAERVLGGGAFYVDAERRLRGETTIGVAGR